MLFSPHRIAAAAIVTGGLTLLAAPAAQAVVPDPVATVECLTTSAGDVTGLVDPSAPGVPSEIPGTNCLAP